MESLNVKNINDEKIFNVIDPNGQGEVVNRIRPISISINQKAETINDQTDSTINLAVYWNDTWKSIVDLTFDESLRQEYGKLTQDLTNIQKDIDMKQYKDAETKTNDFLKYVANLSSKYTAIPEKAVVSKIKNDFVKIKADKNSVKVAISDKLLNFMLKKYAKVDNLDYTKSNECFSTSKFNCLANNYDIYYHSPEIFQKQAYMTVVKDNKVVGSYKVNYDQFSKFASKFMLTPQKLGYSKDRLAGYMKTAEVVMQNIFFDSVDEAKEWQEMVDEKKKEQATNPEGEEETTETTTTETKTEMGEGKSESPIKEDGGLARPSEDFASDEIPESEPRQQEQQGGGQNLGASKRVKNVKKTAKVGYNAEPENELEEKAVEIGDEIMNVDWDFGYEIQGIREILWQQPEKKQEVEEKIAAIDKKRKEAIEKVVEKYRKEFANEEIAKLVDEHLEDNNFHTASSIVSEFVDNEILASKKVKLNKKAEEQIPDEHIYEIIYLGFGQWQYIPTPLKPYIKQVMDILVEKGLAKVHDFGRGKGKYDSDLSIKEYVEKVKNIPEIMSIINKIYQKFGKKSFRLKSLNKKALYGDVQEQDIVPAKTETKVYLQSEKVEDFVWLINGSGTIEILAPKALVMGATGSGDNSEGVNKLRDYIKKDLEKISVEEMQKTVSEYGIDNVKEMDKDELERYLVWLLAGDTADNLENRLADEEDLENIKAKNNPNVQKQAEDKGNKKQLPNFSVTVRRNSDDEVVDIIECNNQKEAEETYKYMLSDLDKDCYVSINKLVGKEEYTEIKNSSLNKEESCKKANKNKLVNKQAEEQIVEDKIEQQVGEDGDIKATIGIGDVVTVNFDLIDNSTSEFEKYEEFIGKPMLLMETDKEDINKVIIEETEYPFQRLTIDTDKVELFDDMKGTEIVVEDTDGDEMITTFEELPVVAKQCKVKSIHKAANITKKKANLKAINSLEDVAGLIDTIVSDYDWYGYFDSTEVGELSLYDQFLADVQKDEKGTIENILKYIAEDDDVYTAPEVEQLKEYYNAKFGGK